MWRSATSNSECFVLETVINVVFASLIRSQNCRSNQFPDALTIVR